MSKLFYQPPGGIEHEQAVVGRKDKTITERTHATGPAMTAPGVRISTAPVALRNCDRGENVGTIHINQPQEAALLIGRRSTHDRRDGDQRQLTIPEALIGTL